MCQLIGSVVKSDKPLQQLAGKVNITFIIGSSEVSGLLESPERREQIRPEPVGLKTDDLRVK